MTCHKSFLNQIAFNLVLSCHGFDFVKKKKTEKKKQKKKKKTKKDQNGSKRWIYFVVNEFLIVIYFSTVLFTTLLFGMKSHCDRKNILHLCVDSGDISSVKFYSSASHFYLFHFSMNDFYQTRFTSALALE